MKKRERIKAKSIDLNAFYEMVDEIKKVNFDELNKLDLDLSQYIIELNGSITIHESLNNEKYNNILMNALKKCSKQ